MRRPIAHKCLDAFETGVATESEGEIGTHLGEEFRFLGDIKAERSQHRHLEVVVAGVGVEVAQSAFRGIGANEGVVVALVLEQQPRLNGEIVADVEVDNYSGVEAGAPLGEALVHIGIHLAKIVGGIGGIDAQSHSECNGSGGIRGVEKFLRTSCRDSNQCHKRCTGYANCR